MFADDIFIQEAGFRADGAGLEVGDSGTSGRTLVTVEYLHGSKNRSTPRWTKGHLTSGVKGKMEVKVVCGWEEPNTGAITPPPHDWSC